MKAEVYFNFPIVLLEGFLTDSRKCLDNIFDYALYVHTLNYDKGTYMEKIKSVEKFFGVSCGNRKSSYNDGQELYNSIPEKTPKAGINKDMWFDFYKNEKDDFQKACLLGFLAIKPKLSSRNFLR